MVQDLLRRSSKATCGALERELVVNPKNIARVKARLRAKGFRIVGTSEERDKVWFVSRAAALL